MSSLIESLSRIVGSKGVLTGDDVAARATSWRRADPIRAAAIVRPRSTEEVSAVMRACYEAGQVVIPSGGTTGLVDGTLANEGDVILSLERMNRIESLDAAGCTITVEAGVILQGVQDRAAEEGLMFPVDFGARGTAQVGGAISTNAGGNAVMRYGMMREQVLGLEAVLADGTVLSSMNRLLKNNAGYDLKQLFIGTEGTLGIITRAVLRLRPALASRNTAFVAIDDYANVPILLNRLGRDLGGLLSAFEVLWSDFYETVVVGPARHKPPLPGGHAFYALIESRGGDQEGDRRRFEEALAGALEDAVIVDAVFAESVQQRQAIWAIRDDIDSIQEQFDPMISFDISLPIGDIDEYATRVRDRMQKRWPDVFQCATFGHLADNNLHLVLTVGSRKPEAEHEAMEIVYAELEPFGGSISAEHGIGLEKRPYLKYSRSETEIALMRGLKQALDPKGLLNPGKVFSTGS